MTTAHTNALAPRKPLRLWPGVAAVTLQWLAWILLPALVPGGGVYAMLAGVACGLMIVVWWLFFSRAPWSERVGALVLMVVALLATKSVVHQSIATAGMGVMMFIFAIPLLSLALVVSAAVGRRLSSGARRAAMAVAIVLACGVLTLLRTGGMSGEGDADLHWRWTPTPEELLLARGEDRSLDSAAPSPAPAAAAPSSTAAADAPEKPPQPEAIDKPTAPVSPSAETAEKPVPAAAKVDAAWPGFRGPRRDGVIRGVRIETDWSRMPPIELWRRPIGPGWSSFAVRGDLVYTQEQRGEDEIVSSYKLSTGEPVWRHRDAVRFWESNGGAGPRATPTVYDGRVYTFGATGILNALDAETGAVIWSRNAATDTGTKIPDWGFASSPLVVNDVVIVAVSGQLAAYDAARGDKRWFGPEGGAGYSSPHLATIDGVAQILLLRGSRTISVSPADGTLLWEHTWQPGVGIVQPALATDGGVLIATGDAMGGVGMRRVAVAHKPAGWSVEERWTSRGLKPYFNDFVVHKGHAFGFDGSILSCVDLHDGQRKWKGGRYGHGQLLLLPDEDVLLVLSEEGELALVRASPDQHTELARFKAIEGKTWNHPVLVGDIVLVRNGEEMAAFRLSVAGR